MLLFIFNSSIMSYCLKLKVQLCSKICLNTNIVYNCLPRCCYSCKKLTFSPNWEEIRKPSPQLINICRENKHFYVFTLKQSFFSLFVNFFNFHLQIVFYCPLKSSLLINCKKNVNPESEFKEFEPRLKLETRLKYSWFHLRLYSMFQDLSRR